MKERDLEDYIMLGLMMLAGLFLTFLTCLAGASFYQDYQEPVTRKEKTGFYNVQKECKEVK